MQSMFRTFYLGTVRYGKALKLQQALVKHAREDHNASIPTLLLLQHNPVYTVGNRDGLYSIEEENYLKTLGADFYRTNRGGLITFHGPGQLVAYPIFSTRKVPISVRQYITNLEQVTIKLCKRYGLEANCSPHTGVWIGDSKICAIGVNAQGRVCSHGIALNCNTDLSWFSRIVPCGIKGKSVCSLSEETGRNVPVEEVLPQYLEDFSTVFGWNLSQLEDFSNLDDVNSAVFEATYGFNSSGTPS